MQFKPKSVFPQILQDFPLETEKFVEIPRGRVRARKKKKEPARCDDRAGYLLSEKVLSDMSKILTVLLEKMIDEDKKIRLWARVFPWVIMACICAVTASFCYSLIK